MCNKPCAKEKSYQVVSYLFSPVVPWQCFNMPQPGLEVDAVMPWTLDTMKVDECFNRVHLNFGFNKTAELVVCSWCCWMLFWTRKGIRVLVLLFLVGQGLLFFLVFSRYSNSASHVISNLSVCLALYCSMGQLFFNHNCGHVDIWHHCYRPHHRPSHICWRDIFAVFVRKKGPLLM